MKKPANTKPENEKTRQLTLTIIIVIVIVVMCVVWWYFEARIKAIK